MSKKIAPGIQRSGSYEKTYGSTAVADSTFCVERLHDVAHDVMNPEGIALYYAGRDNTSMKDRTPNRLEGTKTVDMSLGARETSCLLSQPE